MVEKHASNRSCSSRGQATTQITRHQGEAPAFRSQEPTITSCHLCGRKLPATLARMVPPSLQAAGRGPPGTRSRGPGTNSSSPNAPRPTAIVPVEEPTCLQAIPGSLSIHYNPGNTQEDPSIRKGGVNVPSLCCQSQAHRLLPCEGQVAATGPWTTPPLGGLYPSLPHTLRMGGRPTTPGFSTGLRMGSTALAFR